MEPRFDRERVKQIAGWTFLQWARAAAFMSNYPGAALPPITLDGLMIVQRFWLERHATDEPPPAAPPLALENMPRTYFRWAWTCGAFASAAAELHPHLRRSEPNQ